MDWGQVPACTADEGTSVVGRRAVVERIVDNFMLLVTPKYKYTCRFLKVSFG